MGIVWLASYPKSGNTWVRAFLANLFANPEAPVPVNRLPNFVHADHVGAHYEAVSGKPFAQLTDADIHRLRPAVQRHLAAASERTIFCKTHNALTTLDGLPTIDRAVTQGVIYVVRNPLDVCLSYADHYGMDLEKASWALCASTNRIMTEPTTAFQVLGSWSDHARSWVLPPRMPHHVMRYEDMIARPIETFRALTTFLVLPDDAARLKKAVAFSRFDTLRRLEAEDGFVERSPHSRRFFRSGKVGQWRGKLAQPQIDRLVEHHRDVMRHFGYLDATGRVTRKS